LRFRGVISVAAEIQNKSKHPAASWKCAVQVHKELQTSISWLTKNEFSDELNVLPRINSGAGLTVLCSGLLRGQKPQNNKRDKRRV
jgi:hypothetical protein